MVRKLIIYFSLLALQFFLCSSIFAQKKGESYLEGVIYDKSSGEPVIGATVFILKLNKVASTDIDGSYSLTGLNPGQYKVEISCIGYQSIAIEDVVIGIGRNYLEIVIEESANFLEEVVVTSVRRMNSELAMIQTTRMADVVMSGMSGREITKSQDRNAAEVVKRIPGVSIINDRYIIVRGLPSRYNNVWLNNSAVPSTEADSRSFSFDILPSSQLESVMIVKSQSPDIPSDFSGGFVKITTGSMPDKSDFSITYGTGVNSVAHFNKHLVTKSSKTDFLGFDNGMRSLASFVPKRLDNYNSSLVSDVTKGGFNNDWSVKEKSPLPDQRVSMFLNRAYKTSSSAHFGVSAALNYSLTSNLNKDMLNARFGVYNTILDEPEYIYKYTDNQYSQDVRVGAMLNFTYMNKKNKLEFRNLLNLLGKNRYTTREGWQNVSQKYIQEKQEYIYTNRTTYTSQIAGKHNIGKDILDWNLSYSYASMDQPDRRIINREQNMIYSDENYGKMGIDQNEITRDFIELREHIVSPALNYSKEFYFNSGTTIDFKTGILADLKTREYNNRFFQYRYNRFNMPSDFEYSDVITQILIPQNYGANKLYIYEDTDNRNSYKGDHYNGAGYFSLKYSKGAFNIVAGARLEAGVISLTSFNRIYEFTKETKDYDYFDIYPSINATYNLNKKNLVRVAYGKSVNRQEFRELSSSVYYDFNLFSDVKGNPDLKQATINNVDIRFEHYPSKGEYVTLALFYKNFKNPIEWTYLDAGGSYTYTFENAKEANNWGVEADIKKDLAFIGLRNFSLGLNAAYVYSKVNFCKGTSLERDRAMQGQSPYIINSSLFYDNNKLGISAGLMYNRIGKRIVGIGRADTSSGGSINNDVPDTYELPRDLIDLSFSKRIGERFELKASLKDILNQNITFTQYPKYVDSNGSVNERSQIAKQFSPGAYFSLSLQVKL